MIEQSLIQDRILSLLRAHPGQWFTAAEIGKGIGRSNIRSVGCSARGLFANGYVERRGACRDQQRYQTQYRVSEDK